MLAQTKPKVSAMGVFGGVTGLAIFLTLQWDSIAFSIDAFNDDVCCCLWLVGSMGLWSNVILGALALVGGFGIGLVIGNAIFVE